VDSITVYTVLDLPMLRDTVKQCIVQFNSFGNDS